MLKYNLNLHPGGTMIFKVTEQTQGVYDFLGISPFKASNGWRIVSHHKPEIDIENKVLFLRGSDRKRDLLGDININVSKDAYDKISDDIINALAELKATIENINKIARVARFIGIAVTGKLKMKKVTDKYYCTGQRKIRQYKYFI
jgi:hypothetical protein